jgi:NAD(P)-dependent dehydrogenase (short-subunit alcohol dehydrogenase family)
MRFTGKSVVVTGASSGIGRSAAMAFVEEGAGVLLVGRSKAALEEVGREMKAPPGQVVTCAVDVTTDEAPEMIVKAAAGTWGGIDVLVNAAGVIATGTLESTPDAQWDAMMAINLRAPFRLMREAFPHLKTRKGTVVNVSSVNGLRSFAGVLSYCVSKAGLDNLTRCAALEAAPLGVRVNAVNPGVTVTNLHRRGGMDQTQYAAFLDRAKETHPLGRPGRPDEIAALILFLASGDSNWMTGETIPIDGGRHLTCLR